MSENNSYFVLILMMLSVLALVAYGIHSHGWCAGFDEASRAREQKGQPTIDPDAADDDEPSRPVSLILAVVAVASLAYLLLRMFT